MTPQALVAAFAALPALRVTALQNRLCVHVAAIGDCVHLVSDDVRRVQRIYAPNGDPALELVIGDGSRVWPLILTSDEVVFEPESPDALLDSSIRYSVGGMPPLVAYSEMLRDAEVITQRVEARELSLGEITGSYLQVRCFIAGAARFGMRPVAAVGWWERGWRQVAGEAHLPPLRPDPLWDGLAAEASDLPGLTSTVSVAPDERAAIARLSTSDFIALEPGLGVVGLDEDFVTGWRTWLRVTPATLYTTLTAGLPETHVDISLYPDGGGGIDVWIDRPGGHRAFLRLRFSFVDSDMSIDEIRIPEATGGGGLFQRLIFNTERLTARLGLGQVSVHATGIGAYALAGVGVYPRDPELYRLTEPRHRREQPDL